MNFALDGTRSHVSDTYFALCKGVNTPHSLARWICFRDSVQEFLELSIDPKNYVDERTACFLGLEQRFAHDLLCAEFLSKYKGLETGVDTRQVCLTSFIETEGQVRKINSRLRYAGAHAQEARYEAIISMARRKIELLLGDVGEIDLAKCDWGPGSTYSIGRNGEDTSWDKKILEKRISVTKAALPLVAAVMGSDIHLCRARGINAEGPCTLMECEFQIVRGNRITTVPKNAKTDRTIAIEPSGNIFLQKGIGAHIRSRLKAVRVDLNTQSNNQYFASIGWSRSYATIDLKAASDSISRELIYLLLPERWVHLLNLVRSPEWSLDSGKTWNYYEKWSSMGNGYTFELESLLFYAICSSVSAYYQCHQRTLVFGDDIIVGTAVAEPTIDALNFFGFQTNQKKTHFQSGYRESCGEHYFYGDNVTPVYQKEVPSHVGEVYRMSNRLRRVALRLGAGVFSCKRIRGAWHRIARVAVLHKPTCYIPLSNDPRYLSDDGIALSTEDTVEFGLPILAYGTKNRSLVFQSRKREFDHAGGFAISLRRNGSLGSTTGLREDNFEDRGDPNLLAVRNRGKWRVRWRRLSSSFSSSAWL